MCHADQMEPASASHVFSFGADLLHQLDSEADASDMGGLEARSRQDVGLAPAQQQLQELEGPQQPQLQQRLGEQQGGWATYYCATPAGGCSSRSQPQVAFGEA